MAAFNGRVEFKLPSLPPSMNALYEINYRRRQVYMKTDVRAYKGKMKMFVPKLEIDKGEMLTVEFRLHGDWLFKNGKIRKVDVQNLLKVLCDCVSEKMGFDDCQFYEVKGRKVQSKDEFVEVVVGRFGDALVD